MEEFRFTTKTDFGVFRDYWMFTLFKKRGPKGEKSGFFKYLIILCALVAAMAVFAVLNATVMENMAGVIPLILLLGVAAALVSAVVTATRSQPKRQYRMVKESIETPQKYTFTDAQMEVREYIPEEERESLAEFPYDKFVNAYETGKAFYLFISEVEAFLIPKDQLTDIDEPEFAAFLAKKLGERYYRQG